MEDKIMWENGALVGMWVITLDSGLRLLGKVSAQDNDGVMVIRPAFEYMTQIAFVQNGAPRREEAIVAVDLIGDVGVTVRPTAYFYVNDLPEWRQREIGRLIEHGLAEAQKLDIQKKTGLVLP